MTQGRRLRTTGVLLIALSFLTGIAASWLWFSSIRDWDAHLTKAYVTGISLNATLRHGAPAPAGLTVAPASPQDAKRLSDGDALHVKNLPRPAFLTNITLLETAANPLAGDSLSLVIVSNKLQYAVSEISSAPGQTAAQKLGNVTRSFATFCSEPVIFAKTTSGPWHRIEGNAIWGCQAAPKDLRLVAVLLAALSIAILGTLLIDTVAHFDRFASALRDRGRIGGPERYPTEGPQELRDIVTAVNSYLQTERDQLKNRAVVLSGVSHDLGTPATRLRLRTALIPEQDLRDKFEADIDSMTDMIESVLTYTRAELNVEDPRRISLLSFVQALVDDYADVGRPVTFIQDTPTIVESATSVFGAQSGHGITLEEQRVLVVARPTSLKRAVSNLIDNALKYGRRASVKLVAGSEHVVISVEDEGSEMSVADVEAQFAPFRRGDNIGSISGYGLGLTIVATVAEQHGGRLFFEEGTHGLRACLEICRN